MVHALGDVYRRKTYDSKASRLQPNRARSVARRRPIEHLTADFDHQARREAREINDVWPKQRLPAESETIEPLRTQARPQVPLDPAHRAAEISGEIDPG
jgi:hypothetical protein